MSKKLHAVMLGDGWVRLSDNTNWPRINGAKVFDAAWNLRYKDGNYLAADIIDAWMHLGCVTQRRRTEVFRALAGAERDPDIKTFDSDHLKNEDTYDCDGCGKATPFDKMHSLRSSQGDTTQCEKCLSIEA